ncbi:MAG: glutathione S-transferase family protein [Alphaproteobacteria bacterium]|nr:glutathione S-transferase family protein [Alphaproteobacteria bacterium]
MADIANAELKLYHAPRTRSIRVKWLLEEIGLPYSVEDVQFKTRPAGDEAYAKINPLRKVPALTDGDTVVCESLAIMQYILGRYAPDSSLNVRPDEADYGRFLNWLHFGEAGMLMPVSLLMGHTVLLPEDKRSPEMAAWSKVETDKVIAALAEAGIEDREFIAADRFTAADISVVYMLFLLKLIGQFDDLPESVKSYFKRMTERDGWKTATA